MSIIEDVGARVRAAAEELPLGQLAQALEKFGQATERLRWVRQESANPMGVPELSAATEHAETAGYALRVAQEQLSAYLAAIGLAPDGAPPPRPDGSARQRHDEPREVAPPAAAPAPEQGQDPTVRRWWAARVAELTGGSQGAPDALDPGIDDPRELLHRVAAGVRSGDRGRLHRELRGAHADVGLGLAAVSPPVLRELATELLGHPPRADDLDRLRRELSGRVRDLLPGLPPPAVETLLTRVCRMPPPPRSGEPPHAADSAVTAAVATGVLAARLGRDVAAQEPSRPREGAAGDRGGSTAGRGATVGRDAPAGRGAPATGRGAPPGGTPARPGGEANGGRRG
ncbi:hypothetical protein [Micromonospora mirobrigensis]|uniref:Uncharacterized protein n=1 Tax=Micromonospora mirobrigensis TaxID=262898 RepID=A0A1C4YR04_9ACTN|nr:hypothetical protein [Micromonospora mirobrigensis]SCF23106.1 hypothetical protein GA0070564_104297 [Micromonospora mirobrigensis]